jgi:SAM-dependent methyltransferase
MRPTNRRRRSASVMSNVWALMDSDAIYRFNHDRWEALVKADALFSRPWLTETKESALCRLDPLGLLGDVSGKDVLCLAGGGGQQAVAFALNGAHVSVFDISAGQLERDQQAACHYGYPISTFQGDMRDLEVFEVDSFDIVSQPYSLNFVPDCREVFAQVTRVLRPGDYLACPQGPVQSFTTRDWSRLEQLSSSCCFCLSTKTRPESQVPL